MESEAARIPTSSAVTGPAPLTVPTVGTPPGSASAPDADATGAVAPAAAPSADPAATPAAAPSVGNGAVPADGPAPTAGNRVVRRRRRRTSAVVEGLRMFAVRAVVVVVLAEIGLHAFGREFFLSPGLGGRHSSLLLSFFHWDAVHYQTIALHGYDQRPLTVFFPLYPLMIRALHAVGVPAPDGALALSWAATAAAAAVLVHLARDCFALERWSAVVVLALWSPASFFFFTGYPEPFELLLLAAVLAFVATRRFAAAAVAAGVASALAPFGAFFVVPVAVGMVQAHLARPRDHPNRTIVRLGARLAGAVVVSEIGVAAYGAYLWAAFGSPTTFVSAQSGWNRILTYPLHSLIWPIVRTLSGQLVGDPRYNANVVTTDAIDIAVALAAIAAFAVLVVAVVRHGGRSSVLLPGTVLLGLSLLFELSDAPAGGVSPEALARHLAVVVPVFVAGASIRRPESLAGLVAVSAVLGAVAQIFYFHGMWFT